MSRPKPEFTFFDPLEEAVDPELLDVEDVGLPGTSGKPWDPAKIRITTRTFSLRDIVNQIDDEDIDLSPDFQREFVWKNRQLTRLIESVLLGIPLPAFYFNQELDGRYRVIDGTQRLTTISRFMNDSHALDSIDLQYLKHLDGRTYSGLDGASQRRFRATQIVVHVIEPQTPYELKYDIFSRVNTLGSPLSAQEIRHAMSGPRSREFLKTLTEMEEFDRATELQFWRRDPVNGSKVRDGGRMTNREMALRFCAFLNYSDSDYRDMISLDAFLVDFTKRIDGSPDVSRISNSSLVSLENDFKRAMSNAYAILGNAAFRRWPFNQTRRGPINRALFEAQGIALSQYELDELLPKKDEITTTFRLAFRDSEYLRSVSVGTGSPNAVKYRLSKTKRLLERVLR